MVRLSADRERFTCCFCLHVRTGTILLGVCQIIIHLIAISLLILFTLRPELLPTTAAQHGAFPDKGREQDGLKRSYHGSDYHAYSAILHLVPGISDLQDVVATPKHSEEENNDGSEKVLGELSKPKVDPLSVEANVADDGLSYRPNESNTTLKRRRQLSPSFALCLSSFSLAFCCFLVHGAVTRQPTHLLPFFFLQVFDFIISLLTVVGYMSSTPDVRLWLRTKDGAMFINSTSLAFLLLFISLIVLAFKAYCLRMVWDCYKFLMLTHNRGDRALNNWVTDRFNFLPSIWGFLGTGRRSSLLRSNMPVSSDNRAFGTGSEESRSAPTVGEQSNDLPNYEDALKIPANAYAPPPYFRPADSNKPATSEITSNVSTDQITLNTDSGNTARV